MEQLTGCTLCGSGDFRTIDGRSTLCRCRACGFLFHNPRPASGEIADYYSQKNKYEAWLDRAGGRKKMWEGRLRRVRKFAPSGRLLDVGAGIGDFLHAARHVFTVTGTEVSASAVSTAAEHYGLRLLHGPLETLDLPGRFDVVTLFHVLEHVPSPAAVIERCVALLEPGGVIVIAVPNERTSIESFIKRTLRATGMARFRRFGIHGIGPVQLDNPAAEIHLSYFTASILEKLLAAKGLEVLESSLDRSYASTGLKRRMHDAHYLFCSLVLRIFSINIYSTIWLAARKAGSKPNVLK